MSTATEPRPPEPPPPEPEYEPPRMKYLAAALAALLAAVGLFALFGGDSSEPSKPTSAENLPFIDGTLTVVEQNRLVLKPFTPYKGKSELNFVILPADQGNFDIAHLQSHSSVGIPTRLYFRDDRGTLYAVYKEDAPVNSQQQAR
jgi:hypothetical protein